MDTAVNFAVSNSVVIATHKMTRVSMLIFSADASSFQKRGYTVRRARDGEWVDSKGQVHHVGG